MKVAESTPSFTIKPRLVHVWSELWHAIAFSLTGTGGALYCYVVFTNLQEEQRGAVAVLALTLVSCGALIIFALEVTYRGVFLRYCLSNIGQSWISRGVLSLFVFGILTISCLFLGAFGSQSQVLGTVLSVIAALAAIVVVVYPSMLFSSAAIPFWRTALLPLEFVVSSGIGGLGIIILWQLTRNGEMPLPLPVVALVGLLAINLVLHMMHLRRIPDSTKDATIQLLMSGKLRGSFLIAFLGFGTAMPLALGVFSSFIDEPARSSVLIVMTVLAFEGVFAQRYTVLRSGIKPALL